MKNIILLLIICFANLMNSQTKIVKANEPLFILNGKIISKEVIEKLDTKIIDSVKVLKEDASTEKYGNKGKFGTIEIYSNQYVFEYLNHNEKIIYVLGGIASFISKEDINFSKKYNIIYHDFGCLAPSDFEKYEKRNQEVFRYLNEKYGTEWQNEIPQNVMGFEKWKKS